ncbi:unnamed protein product [Prunus armeniaca]|uniref:Uncharacterized protein n=1 Tax=Prunus armeniaca TaxID=36596 RepID=A0A6J5WXB0_PRUAR|nr:unnamed protein product [Prunus armeniaca]
MQLLWGLDNGRRVYMIGDRFETLSECMVHLGNLKFCLVCTAIDRRGGDRRQPIWITTFRIDDNEKGESSIKTLHLAVYDVVVDLKDKFNFYIDFSFTPEVSLNTRVLLKNS